MYRVTLHVALHSGTGALSRGPNNVSGTIGFNGAARDHFYALVVDFHGVEINRKGGKRERVFKEKVRSKEKVSQERTINSLKI